MKLFQVAAAPNPTKVMLYIAEREALGLNMGIELVQVNPRKGEQRAPEHLARNPFGTLPVLELDDGSYLLESVAIIYYLEDKFADHSLLPQNLEAKARARDLERIVELRVATPIARYVHATNSPLGYKPDAKVAAEIEADLPKGFDYLENLLSDGRNWLTGEEVSIADCTLQSAFQFARFGKAELLDGYPQLQAWDKRYRSRPAAEQVLIF